MSQYAKLIMWALIALCAATAWAQKSSVLERGTYLMEGLVACGNCHLARDDKGQPIAGKGLSGGTVFDEPSAFKVHAANITPDIETGIGSWTDAQLGRAIREGVRPGKNIIGPPMPIEFYRHISDEDLAAIMAYLRAQPAVRNVVPTAQYAMPLPLSYGPAVTSVKAPQRSDKVKYGEYLANIGHCMHCHSPLDDKGMTQGQHLGSGGRLFPGPWGTSVSRNLTPHASGLKDWSDAQIARVLREGLARDGQHYLPPMPFDFFKNISDADVSALIGYLRTLPPQEFGAKN